MDTLKSAHISELRRLAEGIISVSGRMSRIHDPQYDGPLTFRMPQLSADMARKLLVLLDEYENMALDKAVMNSELPIE